MIDRDSPRHVEEGIALFLLKYEPRGADRAVAAILQALSYLDDVVDDPGVPMKTREVEAYWRRRVPEIVRNLARQ